MKTIFLDRDGVINRNPPDWGYVCNWTDFTFLPNALEAIRDITQRGFRIFVATNQAGIGRGIFTEQQLTDIHRKMLNEIEDAGGLIENIYYCPHHPDAGCECRKPKPGMLLRAVHEYDVDMSNSFFVGDSITDIQAARNAGASPILVLTGHGRDSYDHYINSDSNDKTHKPDKIFTNLYTASRWIIQ
ncbi:D-glycero-beta-D-manno-heptose 1,7-bisphosphate 7-phosphatase [Candidatus Poribacteria bacterium]|nr:D-glycero-beta-D-manno-heptose 1,7-bisphosphate 7-phosphatase [Candidatus Poribacteria bacterium]